MKINSNFSAQQALRGADSASKGISGSLERIATGHRINRAADDASGMMIASSLNSQIQTMSQGIRNANDGISIAQTADGAFGQMTDILQGIRDNVVAAGNGIHSQESLAAIQDEINGAVGALDDIAGSTSFNGQNLFDGTFSNRQFLMGDGSFNGITIGETNSGTLGSNAGSLSSIDVTTPEGLESALGIVDQAMAQIAGSRSSVGASQNAFASSIETMAVTQVNLEASQSRIMDVNLAEESSVFSQMQLLEKASLYSLTKANELQKNSIANLIG